MTPYRKWNLAVEYAQSSLSAWKKARKPSRRSRSRSRDRNGSRWYSAWVSAHSMRTGSPSTFITKLLAAFTGHCWAAIVPFDPKLALGALFVPCPLDKLDEIFIILIKTVIYLVFSTGHAVMVLAFTPQTVMLRTGRTSVVIQLFVETKHSSTASSWTPGGWCMIHLHEFIKWKFLKFLLQNPINMGIDVTCL